MEEETKIGTASNPIDIRLFGKKEAMEERKYKELRLPLDDDDKLATEATIYGNKILPPNGYLIGKITQVDNGMLVEYVKKRPQYPKYYYECCEVLMGKTDFMDFDLVLTKLAINRNEENSISPEPPRIALINNFYKLIICRDAYWKIAGVEMGLGKFWEPDWNSLDKKYNVYNYRGDIKYDYFTVIDRCLLVFPTKEMRNAFYENFKELIEKCKELL